jgi:hypothetical protein
LRRKTYAQIHVLDILTTCHMVFHAPFFCMFFLSFWWPISDLRYKSICQYMNLILL